MGLREKRKIRHFLELFRRRKIFDFWKKKNARETRTAMRLNKNVIVVLTVKCLVCETPESLIKIKSSKTSCALLRSTSKIIAQGFSDGLLERQVDF